MASLSELRNSLQQYVSFQGTLTSVSNDLTDTINKLLPAKENIQSAFSCDDFDITSGQLTILYDKLETESANVKAALINVDHRIGTLKAQIQAAEEEERIRLEAERLATLNAKKMQSNNRWPQ